MSTVENLKGISERLNILIRIVEHGIAAPATTAFICSRMLIDLEKEINKLKPKKNTHEVKEMYYELEKLIRLYNAEL